MPFCMKSEGGIILSLFIYVSGFKNKMGFRNFTTCLNKNSDVQKDNFTANDDFLYWFSGFTDAVT